MKKIVMLLVMVLGLWACSTDNGDDSVLYGHQASEKENTTEAAAALSAPTCFTSLSGNVHVDVSNGLGNPIVVFTPTVTGTVAFTAKFRVRVEVQPLSDCDEMNSNTGILLSFGPTDLVQDVVMSPTPIPVDAGSMPLCYKWRFVFEGMSSKKDPICYSRSIWYESPLF